MTVQVIPGAGPGGDVVSDLLRSAGPVAGGTAGREGER
jgi:hypothetical protein